MNLTNVKARQSYQFRYHLNAFKMWQTGKWLLILLRCFNSNCHINASLRCCQSACHPASWNCEQRDARWGFGEKATECICTSRFVFHLHIMYAHQHWINVHYEVISVFMKGHEICWYSPSVFKALLMQIYFLNTKSKLPGAPRRCYRHSSCLFMSDRSPIKPSVSHTSSTQHTVLG